MIASTLLWGGVLVALLGALSLVWPLRLLRIRRRRTGLLLFVGGAALAVGTALFPSGPARTVSRGEAGGSRLDALMPEFNFDEHHELLIQAPPERVYRAIQEVRPSEIRLLLLLTGIRSMHLRRIFGRDVPPLGSQPPMLEVSKRGGFIVLGEDPGREIVQGACGQFWRLSGRAPCPGVVSPEAFGEFHEPGYAKAAINFRVVPEGASSRVITETRILATDDAARRRFAAYWRVIYPGSALIRMGWLSAIRRRAEYDLPR